MAHIHLKATVDLPVYQVYNRYDPTRTTTLRNAFVSEVNRRFKSLKRKIVEAIVEQDVFGLKNAPTTQASVLPGQFAFPRSEDKVKAFMDWLERQEKENLLGVKELTQVGLGVEEPWTNKYIYDSYKRGVMRARYELRSAGYTVPSIEESGGISAVINGTPLHLDRLGLLYTRVYSELKGITSQMDQQISRILAQGIADGDGPKLLAKKLVATISGPAGDLGITDTLGRFIPAQRRAQILARTEIIRAHHVAMVREYRNWELEGVKVQAEWQTAGDSRVCATCAELEGKVYNLDEIEPMIPRHPQCRCVALPITKKKAEESMERAVKETAKKVVKETPKPIPLSEDFPLNMQEAVKLFTSDEVLKGISHSEYKNLEDMFTKVFGSRAKAKEYLDKILENTDVYMAIDKSTLLNKIIKGDGKFKNSLETGKGTFKTIGEERAQVEQMIFGIADDVSEVDKYPKYGFISTSEEPTYENIVGWGYGDTFVKFKKERILNRTSITIGDSFDTNRYYYVEGKLTLTGRVAPPTPLANPQPEAFANMIKMSSDDTKKYFVNEINHIQEYGSRIGSYVEAQIYGKLTLDDVDTIFVTSKKAAENIKKALKAKGITHIKVKGTFLDERIKLFWEFANSKNFSDKATQLACSLTVQDLDKLGPKWIDALFNNWFSNFSNPNWSRSLPGVGNGNGKRLYDKIQELLKKGTPTFQEKKDFLSFLYSEFEKPKGQSAIPDIFLRERMKSLVGWTSDVLDSEALELGWDEYKIKKLQELTGG